MRIPFRPILFGLVLLVGLMPLHAGSEGPVAVTGVRLGVHEQATRFVLDLTGPLSYSIFTLADPYRVVIDLPEAGWHDTKPKSPPQSLITAYRFGVFRPGRGRIVLDLTGPARVTKAMLLPPRDGFSHRLVLDLVATDRASFLADAGFPASEAAPSAARNAPPNSVVTAKSRKPVIVIDPGHGGIDPGAQGADGTLEKDVVLAFAEELSAMLSATKLYDPILTRTDDHALRLPERVDKARSVKADLFISLHADALSATDVRGMSVYTLSEVGSDSEAEALAQKENRAGIITGVDLSGEPAEITHILIDLAQRQTLTQSQRFAETVTGALKDRTGFLKHTHRSAAFRVLKAPDVPSVLIELGYLSNAQDLANLTSESWRQAVATGLVSAVNKHFQDPDNRRAEGARQASK